jgi:hypothetical protein
MRSILSRSAVAATLSSVMLLNACGDDGGDDTAAPTPSRPPATATPMPTATPNLPGTVPDFAAATFSSPTAIDNPYLPLVAGTTRTYFSETEDGVETTVVEVLDETRDVAGVTARVVRDRVFLDGEIIEDTHDWFAQDDAGNVWYLGEEVDEYVYDDEGELLEIEHGGAWEAGEDVADIGVDALPGHVMKASPVDGDLYHQEYYPGVAEDMAEVLALGMPITLTDGSAYSTLQTRDFTPLEADVEELKYYARGIGVVLEENHEEDVRAELTGVFLTGPDTIPDFDASRFADPTSIDHRYFPLLPGTIWTYEGETEDGVETTVVEVLDDTRQVAGITARVVRDRVYLEDLLVEDTHDWYAQDDAGNVWYMGEEVNNYNYDDEDNLIVIDHHGAWEAGLDIAGTGANAVAGILIPADPQPRQSYRQGMSGHPHVQGRMPGQPLDVAGGRDQELPLGLGTDVRSRDSRDSPASRRGLKV